MREQAEFFFADKPVPGVLHTGLRLYALCKSTRWSHLPLAGGWYDQSPLFIEHMVAIMGVESRVEKKKRDAEAKKNKPKRR